MMKMQRDAVRDDEHIISDNMKLIQELVDDEKIPYSVAIETNASIDQVKALSATADLIVIDEQFDKMTLLSDLHISLKDILHKTGTPIFVIPTTSYPR